LYVPEPELPALPVPELPVLPLDDPEELPLLKRPVLLELDLPLFALPLLELRDDCVPPWGVVADGLFMLGLCWPERASVPPTMSFCSMPMLEASGPVIRP